MVWGDRGVRELAALITVHGTPEPAGSKRAFVVNGRARVSDTNPRSREWKQRIAQAAGEQYGGELLDGPLSLELTFVQPRPAGHHGTGRNAGRVRPSAPEWPTVRPDALKLARAVEDSLTGVVYRDDAQIVDEHLIKTYGDRARCEIAVYRMGTAAAREAAQEGVAWRSPSSVTSR